MDYRVKFAPKDLLQGRAWLICRQPEETTLYLCDGEGLTLDEKAVILEEAWAGYRKMTERDVPTQRDVRRGATAMAVAGLMAATGALSLTDMAPPVL